MQLVGIPMHLVFVVSVSVAVSRSSCVVAKLHVQHCEVWCVVLRSAEVEIGWFALS